MPSLTAADLWRKVERQPMDGALLVAASVVSTIRLRGQEITRSPKLAAVVGDSVLLARTVLAAIKRESQTPFGIFSGDYDSTNVNC